MINDIIIKVFSYLKECQNCHKYNSVSKNNICDFCKKYYCDKCNDKLRTFYGFSENNYCHDCNEFLYMEVNF